MIISDISRFYQKLLNENLIIFQNFLKNVTLKIIVSRKRVKYLKINWEKYYLCICSARFQVEAEIIGNDIHYWNFEAGVERPAERENRRRDSAAGCRKSDALLPTETPHRVKNRLHKERLPSPSPRIDEGNLCFSTKMHEISNMK